MIKMYDIIIIGAGTAGLTAGIYGARAGKKVLILESITYGGQILKTNNVENYPGIKHIAGYQFAKELYDQAISFGCDVRFESVISLDKTSVTSNKDKYNTKTIIVATGLENRKLNIDREEELIGKGISYCATCDGNFYRNKDVAVTGSGNTALEDAIYLSNIANHVYLLVRSPKMHADKYLLDKAKKLSNIEIIYETRVSSLEGKDSLESIIISKNDLFRSIDVSALFIAIGYEPKTEIFSSLIDIDDEGYIISHDCTTNVPNIFVAGDVRTKHLRQLTTAASDGAIAADLAIKYIDMN